jgi:hypothetical protein
MLVDTESLAADHEFQADVCIVGAGAAGITIARELAPQASGTGDDWSSISTVGESGPIAEICSRPSAQRMCTIPSNPARPSMPTSPLRPSSQRI